MSEAAKDVALVLAAGKGVRMRSGKPKVLQTILGSPMLSYVLRAASAIFGKDVLIVAGHGADQLEKAFPDARFVSQPEQRGTGDALKAALPALQAEKAEYITVINGDVPLISPGDIEFFIKNAGKADIAFATITLSDPGTYGRVIRRDGILSGVIEAKDYNIDELGEPTGEVNAGLYRLRLDAAVALVPEINNANKSGEYYITDLIGLGIRKGLDVRGVPCGNDDNFLGINTPLELSAAENRLAASVVRKLQEAGVMVHAPHMLRVSPFAHIAPGVQIWGPCEIYGDTEIEAGAEIGFCCRLSEARIGENARVESFSNIENAIVGKNARVGPYARLRPGANVGENARIGNFVEMKNASLAKGAKANHLSYLGDAEIGAGTNIGAGTITCNYDGEQKHKTVIGAGAFIGSNTALVAPVTIGDKALIGAGSVITEDVPPGDMAISRARQINKPGNK